jgi:hypothetical protein
MRRSRRNVKSGAIPTASTPRAIAVAIVDGAIETIMPRSGMSVARFLLGIDQGFGPVRVSGFP